MDAIDDEARHAFYVEESCAFAKSLLADVAKDPHAAKWESLSKSPVQLSKFNASDERPPYVPSPYSIIALNPTPATAGFQRCNWKEQYSGRGKVLILATSAYELRMQNGKGLFTGHHTTELFVPMIHLHDAGFEFVIATMDGKPVRLDEWTFLVAAGYEDDLRGMAAAVEGQLKNPRKTSEVDIVEDNIIAVFLPGGPGAMTPQMGNDPAVGKLLHAAHDRQVLTAAICHGVHPLVAARLGDGGEFPYKGYEAVCFPDYLDEPVLPESGYLPGKMVTLPQADLRANGVDVKNTESANMPMDQIWLDRGLLTGLSFAAAQKFGEKFVELLMQKHMPGMTSNEVFKQALPTLPEDTTPEETIAPVDKRGGDGTAASSEASPQRQPSGTTKLVPEIAVSGAVDPPRYCKLFC